LELKESSKLKKSIIQIKKENVTGDEKFNIYWEKVQRLSAQREKDAEPVQGCSNS
jgi:hypothetical protein